MKETILIVEDDPLMLKGLFDNLNYEGYQLLCTTDGLQAWEMAAEQNIDLILLDVQLPKLDGISLCRRLREAKNYLPIIMLTARGSEHDKVQGLDVGADDYLTKPFSIRELSARIKSLLRRSNYHSNPINSLFIGEARIDFGAGRVYRKNKTFELAASEENVLKLLAQSHGRVVTREQFIANIGSGRKFTNTRSLDNFMVKLRRKLESDPANPQHIVTVHGVGYKLIYESTRLPQVCNL